MAHSTLFKNNRSQALRLPRDVAFPEEVREVHIIKQGKARLLVPRDALWDDWFEKAEITDDFLTEREQPRVNEREKL